MKKSKFSEEQIAYAFREVESGRPPADLCGQLGVGEATSYIWRKKYAHLGVSELRQLRALEDENARLKRLVADLSLDKHIPGLSHVRIALVFVMAAGCSQPRMTQPQSDAASTPASAAAPVQKSEAIARADALLEDLRRREAAQAKFDRETKAPAAIPIIPVPVPVPASKPISSPATVASESKAATQAAPAAPADATRARDEQWWKQQMRSLQMALDEELIKLAAAEKANLKYGYNDAQAEYKKLAAAVANARQAIDRLHDDARRAGVPPSWLRLP